MKPLDAPLLADENIHPGVVQALRARGLDVRTAIEEGLGGRDDIDVLRRAHALSRVVLSHDADFGRLAVQAGESFVGIILLRPGHISVAHVLAMIDAVAQLDTEAVPPFIVVAERRGDTVRVRLRVHRS